VLAIGLVVVRSIPDDLTAITRRFVPKRLRCRPAPLSSWRL
jgi:hypothetical protein